MGYSNLKVASWNVNGLNNPVKRSKVMTKIKRENSKVIFLQETHLSQNEHEKLKKFGYRNIFYSTLKTGRKRGAAILIHKSVNFEFIKEIRDSEGRYILVQGKLEKHLTTLISVYLPPQSDQNIIKKLLELIGSETQGTLICAGDFNMVMNGKLDTSNGKRNITSQSKMWKRGLVELSLLDVWRDLHPTDKSYTFYSATHAVHSRIDYFFIFQNDRHRIQDCKIGSRDISDHSPMYLKLYLDSKQKKTIWRLNTSLLNNKTIIQNVKSEIKTFLELNDNGEVNPNILWDTLKAVIRGKLISLSTAIKKAKGNKLKQLEDSLKELEKQHCQNQDPQTLSKIKEIRNQISDIYKEEIEKKLKFLKQTYYEVGPRATKLLARKIRKKQISQSINKILDTKTGQIYHDLEEIDAAFQSYYANLYSQPKLENKENIKTFLDSLDLPSIGEHQNNCLTTQITEKELETALKKLKNNKTPGSDGLPAEWYKIFKQELNPILLNSYNWTLDNMSSPPSWNEAIISVIPKEGKNKMLCSSYRPISILNQDYKLYASIMSRRLDSFIPELIDSDQTGFISGRQTQDNIRRSLHIIQNIKKSKTSAVLASLDAEKAFDCVSWEYLFLVLERFGFNEKAVNNFKTLYSAPTARIRLNGSLTDRIRLERSTRQGCPLSPTLFALYLEPLAQAIREDCNIQGILIDKVEHKIAMYADDVLLYINKPVECLPILLDLLDVFGTYSGYKLNIQKTQILTFNYNPSPELKQRIPIDWSQKAIKYLGVWLTHCPSDLYKKKL